MEAKRAADEASKSAEEKLTAARQEAENYKTQAEAMQDLLASEAKAKIEAQPEALQKLVLEQGGDNPVDQMAFMSSESFKALASQMGGSGARTQGSVNQGAGGAGQSEVKKKYEALKADAMDSSKSPGERAVASQKMQTFFAQNSKQILA